MASRAVIHGLAPLLRDLRAAGELEARKDLMQALRAGGEVVQHEAQRNVIREGLIGKTGRLYRGLKVSATTRRVDIKDIAKNPKDGYRYPSRFEFEGRGLGTVGSRAFLNPGLDSKEREAIDTIARELGKALDKHDL